MRRSLNRLVQLVVMVVISCSWLTSPQLAATAETATTSMPAATAPANEIRVAATFAATDSLAAMPSDARADAQACLEGLCWTPGSFEVEIQKPWKEGAGDFCVCFPHRGQWAMAATTPSRWNGTSLATRRVSRCLLQPASWCMSRAAAWMWAD